MDDKRTVIKLFASLIEDECLGRVDCGGCPFERAEMCGSLDGVEIATELRKCADGNDEDDPFHENDPYVITNPMAFY